MAACSNAEPKHASKCLGSKIFMLVGVPGSGKSTFSASLEQAGYKTISSDNLRSKKGAFDETLGFHAKPSQLAKCGIVVDRCCVAPEERKRLLELMHNPSADDITVVYFNKDIEDCKMQVCSRKNHPTISNDNNNARGIVDSFAKKLVPPKLSEGYGRIEVVESYEQGETFLRSIGITPIEATSSTSIKKFPRTTHLLDAGGDGVTRDDLVMTVSDANSWIEGVLVNVEEKIDGANLGISVDSNYSPLFQNRSHYVNSASASQWKGLDKWWKDHSAVLTTLLEPNRHVLFGEWCALQHSIHYNALPGYFIAFDVYDSVEEKFYSREKLNEFLEPSGIPIIRTITNQMFKSPLDILPLLDTISMYGAHKEAGVGEDGPVEGVYLRVDEGDWLVRRCKIVRPDFVQNIEEHWCKRTPVKNIVRY
jgi:atypical dual specificity phosphatase